MAEYKKVNNKIEIAIDPKNEENIIWYEDDKYIIILPNYYAYDAVYRIIKRYTKNNLIVSNMIDNAIIP